MRTSDYALATALNEFWESHTRFILYEIAPYRTYIGFVGDLFYMLRTDKDFRKAFIKNPKSIKLKLNHINHLEWVQ